MASCGRSEIDWCPVGPALPFACVTRRRGKYCDRFIPAHRLIDLLLQCHFLMSGPFAFVGPTFLVSVLSAEYRYVDKTAIPRHTARRTWH